MVFFFGYRGDGVCVFGGEKQEHKSHTRANIAQIVDEFVKIGMVCFLETNII